MARVTLRDTKSRWGTARDRATSPSAGVDFAPEPVLGYVVAHEVAHLVE
jgi:predicted metal-dependent hydrolase